MAITSSPLFPNTLRTLVLKSYVIFGKTDIDAIDLSKLGDESKYTIDYLGDKNANCDLVNVISF
jgi:hypothetical protein